MDDGLTIARPGFLAVGVETLLATEFPAREMVLSPLLPAGHSIDGPRPAHAACC